MQRVYYYVTTAAGGTWNVKVDGRDAVNFANKEQAIAAAANAARTHWEKNGVRSGVRVQLGSGQWQEERTYGDDPFPPKG